MANSGDRKMLEGTRSGRFFEAILRGSAAVKIAFVVSLVLLVVAVITSPDKSPETDSGQPATLGSRGVEGTGSFGSIKSALRWVKGVIISDDASEEDMAAFNGMQSSLRDIFSQFPEEDQAKVLGNVLQVAKDLGMRNVELFSLYDSFSWESDILTDLWRYVFSNIRDKDCKPAIYAFTKVLTLISRGRVTLEAATANKSSTKGKSDALFDMDVFRPRSRYLSAKIHRDAAIEYGGTIAIRYNRIVQSSTRGSTTLAAAAVHVVPQTTG